MEKRAEEVLGRGSNPLTVYRGFFPCGYTPVAHKTPERIIKCHIDPLMGLQSYQSRDLAAGIDLPREHWRAFGKIALGLWKAYVRSDATLAEINPLVITGDGALLAVDGKMVLDEERAWNMK